MLAAGSVVAGYRVERLLGSGGMGAVYLVANPELPRRDALKVLSAELSRDPSFRARFLREADVASRLDHPNIVSIYRRGETADGQLWIAMQFVDGLDADAALARGEMSPTRAVYVVGEVAKALDYAHHRGVIHRDVKPANVLLSGPVGPDERVLLGDFGIARAFDDAHVTSTGELVATVSYAAPEVIAGDPVDGRADLYSLGCTLFRLLTGQAPFAGAGSQAAVMMAHMHQPPPRITTVAPWLPTALDPVMAKALAKNPAQRFGSARQLAAAAAAALQQGAQAAPTSPIAGPTQPIAGPVMSPQPQPYPPPAPAGHLPAPAGPAPRGHNRTAMVAALVGTVVLAIAAITTLVLVRRSNTHTAEAGGEAVTTTTTTTEPAEPLPASALADVLLSPDEVASAIGSPPLTMVKDNTQMWSGTIVDDDCSSIVVTNEQNSYAGSGYTAVHWQNLNDRSDGQAQWRIGQVVVSFADAESATEYYQRAEGVWRRCANRTVNQRTAGENNDPDDFWAIGPISETNGILAATTTEEGGEGWACQEGLSARNNIIIRVYVCGHAPASVVTPFVEAIAAKVDSQQ